MRTSIAIVSTYPPTQCGIATFAESLRRSLEASGAEVGIVRVVQEGEGSGPSRTEVAHEWRSASGTIAAARAASGHDVTVLQHEYGIFPGPDGINVLGLVDSLESPLITVLHTVVERPTAGQRMVLERVADRSDAIVTMSRAARSRLLHRYDVDPRVVRVIPHGAVDNRVRRLDRGGQSRLLTWGLLGPGKGIEWAIAAMARLADLEPRPVYRVVGQTHPRVLERDGTAYQDSLHLLADNLGVADQVEFDHHYSDSATLRGLVQDSDVVVLPYDSTDQVTSGVLIEAVASARPVVATRFSHAEELLSTGAGITVPHRDPEAIAAAVRSILTEPGLARRMSAEAARLAPDLLWSTVADRYLELAEATMARMAWRAS